VPRFRADWVVPVTSSPIRGGWVAVEDGRIAAVGAGNADAVDLGRVALLPGFVNAHTHLELSHLHGLVPPSSGFLPWVRQVLSLQRDRGHGMRVDDGVRRGIDEARRSGTILLGDISNTLASVPLLRAADMSAHVFHELTGFTEPDPLERVRAARARLDGAVGGCVRGSLAAHAPYSVSAPLFAALRDDLDTHEPGVSSIHLGESVEETDLIGRGQGGFRALLEEMGRWPEDWTAPAVSPVRYLVDLGFLDSRVLAVHGVQFDGDDLALLRSRGVVLVSCPRSNRHVGVGDPPLEAFYAMGVEVALGTDSLASVETLNMFDELAEARRIARRVPASALLRSATLVGAQALGFDDDYGSIEVGRAADLLVVPVPDGVSDVEEYLVGGGAGTSVSWLVA